MRPCLHCWDIGIPFVDLFARWDSAYYANIALAGYPHQITARWAFFPGYPIVIGSFGRLLAMTAQLKLVSAIYLMGFLVSNAAFFGAVYYVTMLSRLILGNSRSAFTSAALLAFYPAGVFLSAVYSDSLFLLLTSASLFYLLKGEFGRTTALGFLASLTRPVGIVLLVPVVYKLLREPSWRKAAPIVGILLAFLSFVIYGQLVAGTPFASTLAEHTYWPFTLNPHDRFIADLRAILSNPIMMLPFLGLGLGGVVAFVQEVRSDDETMIGLYAVCLLAAYLVSPLESFPRYSITLLPTYWTLSRWSAHFAPKVLIWSLFLILLAVGTGLFANWYRFY